MENCPSASLIAIKTYDYSSAGAHFVTFCVYRGQCLLGQVFDHEMHPSLAGQALIETCQSLPQRYPMLALDAYCIMPNHVHLIIWLLHHVDQLYGDMISAAAAETLIANARYFNQMQRPSRTKRVVSGGVWRGHALRV